MWGGTIAFIVALFVFEFVLVVRKPHEPSFKEAVGWSIFYVAIALAFGASMVWWRGDAAAAEFIAGFVTEKSLSVDNLFVFLVILTRFAVPPELRQRVLMFGIILALVLRGILIAVGATALAYFSWVFYLFGAFLIYTAIVLVREGTGGDDEDFDENRVLRMLRRRFGVAPGYVGAKLTTMLDGRKVMTPLLFVMIAIGTTDVLFAFDSIPAIFGLTTDPFIVFATNAFALMGLRQLFFVVDGLLRRLVYLPYGLAAVLAFIGIKLVLEALHTNSLPFVNRGEPVHGVPEIGIGMSLGVIVGILTVATVASLIASRTRK